MKIRVSWRMQLIACVEIALCLLMAAVTWYINSYLFRSILQQTETSQLKNFQKIESELTLSCEETESLADTIFMNSPVQAFCREPQVKDVSGIRLRQDIIAYFSRLLESDPMLHSILLRTSDGYTLGSEGGYTYAALEPGGEAAMDGGRRSWSLLKMNAHPPHTESSYVISSVSSYQYYTRPVEVQINLKEPVFRELYAGVSESETPQLFLCDRSGTLISSSIPQELGGRFEAFDEQMTASPEGSFVLKDKSQVVFSSSRGFDWIIMEITPIDQLNREIDHLRVTLTYLLLGSFAIINLFLFFSCEKCSFPCAY